MVRTFWLDGETCSSYDRYYFMNPDHHHDQVNINFQHEFLSSNKAQFDESMNQIEAPTSQSCNLYLSNNNSIRTTPIKHYHDCYQQTNDKDEIEDGIIGAIESDTLILKTNAVDRVTEKVIDHHDLNEDTEDQKIPLLIDDLNCVPKSSGLAKSATT